MIRSLRLEHVGPAPELEVEFGPRLNLLAGDNGVGKTFLLDVAWWAITQTWVGDPAWPDPVSSKSARPAIHYRFLNRSGGEGAIHARYEFKDQAWVTKGQRRPKPALVLYARIDGSFSVWDPARNEIGEVANGSGIAARERLPAYHFTAEQLWNGLRDESRVFCNGLIHDWVSWQLKKAEPFAQLEGVLKALSPSPEEELRPGSPMRVRVDDVRDHPTLTMSYGTLPLIFASAGIKRIVGLAYLLVWAWQEHVLASKLLRGVEADQVVFLLDEIEMHLHPQWQRLLLPALVGVMAHLQSQARVQVLGTTHAPLVLASVEPIFEEDKDRLIHLRLAGREIRIEDLWAKQGDAVGWLVSDVFGLRQARSKQAEDAIEAAEAWMRGDLQALPEELSTPDAIQRELERLLPGHDPFWPRWIVTRERTGSRLQ